MHLFFTMHLERSSALLEGRLYLIDNCKILDTWIATSGIPGSQASDNQDDRMRGPIPSCSLAKIHHYKVDLVPLAMPVVKGVEGDFYKINPHLVGVGKHQRGDFGIHFDANVPGSSGCVVVRNQHPWTQWQKVAAQMVKQKIFQLPLLVAYS